MQRRIAGQRKPSDRRTASGRFKRPSRSPAHAAPGVDNSSSPVPEAAASDRFALERREARDRMSADASADNKDAAPAVEKEDSTHKGQIPERTKSAVLRSTRARSQLPDQNVSQERTIQTRRSSMRNQTRPTAADKVNGYSPEAKATVLSASTRSTDSTSIKSEESTPSTVRTSGRRTRRTARLSDGVVPHKDASEADSLSLHSSLDTYSTASAIDVGGQKTAGLEGQPDVLATAVTTPVSKDRKVSDEHSRSTEVHDDGSYTRHSPIPNTAMTVETVVQSGYNTPILAPVPQRPMSSHLSMEESIFQHHQTDDDRSGVAKEGNDDNVTTASSTDAYTSNNNTSNNDPDPDSELAADRESAGSATIAEQPLPELDHDDLDVPTHSQPVDATRTGDSPPTPNTTLHNLRDNHIRDTDSIDDDDDDDDHESSNDTHTGLGATEVPRVQPSPHSTDHTPPIRASLGRRSSSSSFSSDLSDLSSVSSIASGKSQASASSTGSNTLRTLHSSRPITNATNHLDARATETGVARVEVIARALAMAKKWRDGWLALEKRGKSGARKQERSRAAREAREGRNGGNRTRDARDGSIANGISLAKRKR